MTLRIYDDIEQGSDAWHDVRRGIVTASTVGLLITGKTVKPAVNETSRALTMQLAAERITGYTEPTFLTRDMERGHYDEPLARDHYSEHYAPVVEVGFMTNTFDDNVLGFSPDGLVGSDGIIEIKSRRQKQQLATIIADEVPLENMAQLQGGLLVSGRAWCDYLSWCGGMPMFRKRVEPDPRWFAAITEALELFEQYTAALIDTYRTRMAGAPDTMRVDHFADIEIS